ncbi:hypothetical protein B0H14DRAFT_2257617, partial [Mycena olivaceomarginata]
PPACPEQAPDWFINAYREVTRTNLGAHFNAAVAAWMRIEAASKFQNPKEALSSKGRPKIIADWIGGGQGQKQAALVVKNGKKFGKEWWKWWDGLQPEWRLRREDGLGLTGENSGEGEWGDTQLIYWGQNGTLSIVAGLFFWGLAVMNDSELRGEWEITVNDTVWI